MKRRIAIVILCGILAPDVYAQITTIEHHRGSYTGEVSNDIPHGKGTWADSHGGKYTGEWRKGQRHGLGTLSLGKEQSRVVTYVGEFRHHKKSGYGTLTLSGGGRYVGEWKANTKQGRGIYTSPIGRQYLGEWREDKIWTGVEFDSVGQAVATYTRGVRYTNTNGDTDAAKPCPGVVTKRALEVNAYDWKGETVYKFHMDCCDSPNPVFDTSCTYQCAPSGGFHGRGDFKCPNFTAEAMLIYRVWP
jgi:hypothetical protein|tara:strand:- start:188 stop:925 length:738 start_codon:yes stop_codon:yes gene_type:complete